MIVFPERFIKIGRIRIADHLCRVLDRKAGIQQDPFRLIRIAMIVFSLPASAVTA